MKRKLWIIPVLAALIALLACGAALADQSGTCGDSLTWTLSDAGELTISGTGEMTEYSYENRPPWYASGASITSITIENGITSLCNRAFQGCTAVTDVTVPPSVAKIDYLAFSQCSALTEITVLNRDAVIGDNDHDVFQNCASGFTLRGFTDSTAEAYANTAGHSFANPRCGSDLTWDLTVYGEMTVSGTGSMPSFSSFPWQDLRTSIKRLVIENGVTNISNYAFYNCSNLEDAKIFASVAEIGYRAFQGCSMLSDVEIYNPDAVIGDSDYDVFSRCSPNLDIWGWSGSTAEAYAAEANIDFLSLGDLSGRCGDSVSWNFDAVTGKVTITGSGPMWDYDEFLGNIPPFYWNDMITSAVIGSGVTSIGDYIFYGHNELAGITIPNSVTRIGNFAFKECSGLTNVTIPGSVTSIGKRAFTGCSGLTSVTIPSSVTSIGVNPFAKCENLSSIQVAGGNTAFIAENGMLYNKQKTLLLACLTGKSGSVTIPGSVKSIGEYAFYCCAGLTEVTIPNSVTSIGERAFYNCTKLTGITLPSGVTSIENSTFSLCKALTGISIPDSVTSIGPEAFYSCDGLTHITIPDSVTNIGDAAFEYCSGLDYAEVLNPGAVFGSDVFYYTRSDFILCGYSGSTAEAYAAANGHIFVRIPSISSPDFTLPSRLTRIEAEAFSGAQMTVVYIPYGVTSIGSRAFASCPGLRLIRIPDSVTDIAEDAFYGVDLSQFTIFGIPGSVANSFADDAGISFAAE